MVDPYRLTMGDGSTVPVDLSHGVRIVGTVTVTTVDDDGMIIGEAVVGAADLQAMFPPGARVVLTAVADDTVYLHPVNT